MTELDAITDLVAPLVDDAGYELYDVQRNGGILSVLVQGADGIDIDELTALSRKVSATLDEHDPIPGRYTLEVSSPGVERRLRREDHFVGAIGETINIRTLAGPRGRRRIVGELSEVDGDILTVEDPDAGTVRLSINEIEKARTVFVWGPAPRPTGAKGTVSAPGKGSPGGASRSAGDETEGPGR